MEKILLTKNQVNKLRESFNKEELSNNLHPFIYKQVKNHMTSLGDNDAFPPEEDLPFDYKILKNRFAEVIDNIKKIRNIESYDENYLSNRLSSCVKECKDLEEAIRPNLEKICTNVILKLFDVPNDTVDFEAKLVDEVNPEHQFRIKPEPSSKRKFDFESLDDFKNANKTVLKRRLINSLIQGASYTYSTDKDLYLSEVYKIDKNLIDLYDEIIAINDYLLFVKEEKITDKTPMQGGCVEVTLGDTFRDKTVIKAQGIIFPFLLHELIKGFMELFASHSLPDDDTKARYIISQSDFLIAEPWDLRMGVGLWHFINKEMPNTNILPYFFDNLCCLSTKEFNHTLKEIFAETKKGKQLLYHLFQNAEDDMTDLSFTSKIDLKNSQVSVISEEEDVLDDIEVDSSILLNANVEDIDFEASPFISNKLYNLNILVNDKPINIEGLRFSCEDKSNISPNAYQLHIHIPLDLRQKGIAYKLYHAFLIKVGDIVSLNKNRVASYAKEHNKTESMDSALDKIIIKLANNIPNANVESLSTDNGHDLGVMISLTEQYKNESIKTYGELINEKL